MNDKVRLGKSPRFALAGHDNGASRRTLVLWCRCKAADCSHDGSYAFHPMSIKEYERRDQTTNDTRGWPWKTSVLYVSEHGQTRAAAMVLCMRSRPRPVSSGGRST